MSNDTCLKTGRQYFSLLGFYIEKLKQVFVCLIRPPKQEGKNRSKYI